MHLLKTCKISRNKFISVMNVWNEYVYNLVIILQGDKFSVIANVATERGRPYFLLVAANNKLKILLQARG